MSMEVSVWCINFPCVHLVIGLFPFFADPISKEDMEDYETKEILLQRLPENTTELQKCIISSQACILLLLLKQHFKTMYRINDQ